MLFYELLESNSIYVDLLIEEATYDMCMKGGEEVINKTSNFINMIENDTAPTDDDFTFDSFVENINPFLQRCLTIYEAVIDMTKDESGSYVMKDDPAKRGKFKKALSAMGRGLKKASIAVQKKTGIGAIRAGLAAKKIKGKKGLLRKIQKSLKTHAGEQRKYKGKSSRPERNLYNYIKNARKDIAKTGQMEKRKLQGDKEYHRAKKVQSIFGKK